MFGSEGEPLNAAKSRIGCLIFLEERNSDFFWLRDTL
jgi:hypothetical protein